MKSNIRLGKKTLENMLLSSRRINITFIGFLFIFATYSLWRLSYRVLPEEASTFLTQSVPNSETRYLRTSTFSIRDSVDIPSTSNLSNRPASISPSFNPGPITFRIQETVNLLDARNISIHVLEPLEPDYIKEAIEEPIVRYLKLVNDFKLELASISRSQKPQSNDLKTLYVIPIDSLAWIKSYRHDMYTGSLKKLIAQLNRSRRFITFRGSNYIFVCLTSFCQAFGSELTKNLFDGQGTRSMFAGVGLDLDFLSWPCPKRVFNFKSSKSNDGAAIAHYLIDVASRNIEYDQRWTCYDEEHPDHHFGAYTVPTMTGSVYMKEYNMVVCQIPKSGSTMLMFLLRRLMHRDNWRSLEDGLPHHPYKSGVEYVSEIPDEQFIKRLYSDPDILKVAVVRHPIPRLLSGYLDKIDGHHEYSRVGNLPEYAKTHGHPTFEEFVNFLISTHPDPAALEAHFALQSVFCGLRDHRFDFIANLDNLGEEFEEFSKSRGFWDGYVSTGWGTNQTQSFGKRSYQSDQRHANAKIWKHYTDELMEKVYEYYEEDFSRFGFTLEEIKETKPAVEDKTEIHLMGNKY